MQFEDKTLRCTELFRLLEHKMEATIRKYIENLLNKQQFEAAIHASTSSLILAWAWSWKTRTLTYKIAYLIFGKWINARNIMAVTFTNKAANEMKERLLEISREVDEHFSSPLPAQNHAQELTSEEMDNFAFGETEIDFDSMIGESFESNTNSIKIPKLTPYSFFWVWTFHGIFLKILKEDIEKLEQGYTRNFWVYDPSDCLSVIKDVYKDHNISADILDPKEAKYQISSIKNAWMTPEEFLHHCNGQQDELVAKVYQKYQAKMKASNSLDFDDLLLLPKQLFLKDEEVLAKRRKQFKYILVDEAQDTNQIQFDLIKLLSSPETNLTFIGDDYQSIYGWRWAVMEHFLNLKTYWPDIQIFKLEVNYRSLPHIVEAWNAIIKQNKKQYEKNVTSHRDWNETIKLFEFADETDEAIKVIDFIKKLKEDKNHKRWDFSILYRTNAQSSPFEQVLVTEWIPYKIWWGFKFFERQEIKDIVSYLKYLINPLDNVALKRIINTPSRKIWKTSIDKLDEYSITHNVALYEIVENIDRLPLGIPSSTQNSIKQFSTIMRMIASQIESLKPQDLIASLIGAIKYKEHLLQTESKEKAQERMDNIGQLINMASKYEGTGIEILRQFMEEISLVTDIQEDWAWEIDVVKLMSVHSSKWLEFPVVFIVGLEETIFPLAKAKFDDREMEEERRLMYVALTRAKDSLYLSYANSRRQWWQQKYNSVSRFMNEIPERLLQKYDLSAAFAKASWTNINVWDTVRHKLFGFGEVLELWTSTAVVKFDSAKFWLRRVDVRFLEKCK